jgi:D-glycero-D-manno-heptose 1,7-bisphosphate phosphatase
MILSAADKLALDLSRSWVVGDAGRDIEAGKAAGCRAILFSDASMKKSPAAESAPKVEPDYTVTTLAEALAFIEQQADGPGESAASAAPTPAVDGSRNELPPLSSAPAAPASAPVLAAQSLPSAEPAPAKEESAPAPTPAPAAATPRVPKVVIGSKYIPPAGKAVRDPAPPREMSAAQVAPRKASVVTEDDDARPATPPAGGFERIESTLDQIFLELRRQHEHHDGEFSVSKLLAGIVQILVLAVLFISYLKRDAPETYLLLAMVLQTMTISLLIMSRQK